MTTSVVERFERWVAERTTEGITLEFKSGKLLEPESLRRSGKHQLTKAVASLANTEGGLVAIGIEEAADEPGWSAADHIEVAPADWYRDRILQLLNDNISPPIPKLDVDVERSAGGVLILVHVPASFVGHQSRREDGKGGEYRTRRANGVSEPLDGRDVRQLLMRTQLPDPVLHLVVPEEGQRATETGDLVGGVSWRLLLTTQTAVLTAYRITLLWDGFGTESPTGFKRIADPPTFGRDGWVVIQHATGASIFPGVYEELTNANIRMKSQNPHHFVAALVQVPGVSPRLFAWHIRAVGNLRKIAVGPPQEAWWAGIDLRDPLGIPIPYERYSDERE